MCKKWHTTEGAVITAEGVTDADMDIVGDTKMPACINLDCPYLDDFRGICTICGTDEDCPLIEDDDLILDIPEDD